MLSFVIFSSLLLISSNALSTSKTPGGNFKLDNFYLTIPDGKASSIDADDLEGGYESSYFYTDSSDGAMVFYVPSSADAPSGYPRCELREQCQAGSNSYNWDLTSGTHQINGQYQITSSTTADYFIIQQIHSKNGPGKPLMKVRYNDGYIRVEIKTNSAGSSETKTQIKENGGSTYVGNDKFWMKTIVQNGYVKTYLNGDRITNTKVSDYWGDYYNYFKAGCYRTTYDSVKAYVKVYSLTVYHSDSSLCKYTSSFTIDDADEGEGDVAVIVAVVIIVLVAVALCGFGFWYYKKKYLPSKGEASFKDDSDVNGDGDSKDSKEAEKEIGDTPTSIGDGDADANADGGNQMQSGYNMEYIDVEVDA